MTKKKERRTPPPTIESLAFKIKVKQGEDVEKRNQHKEEPVAATKKTTEPAKKKAKRQIWGQAALHQLVVNMIEHKDDQAAFVKACSGLKSEAKSTPKFIYESKVFSADKILQKAQQVVKQMRADGYDVSLPSKVRESAVDYGKIYASLGLSPTLKVKKKK